MSPSFALRLRSYFRSWFFACAAVVGVLLGVASDSPVVAGTPYQESQPRPNIVFILADDLGYGDLSCYGQQRFSTPRIDSLARDGIRFTAHYSGHNVCAPARCVLLSGKHPGHAAIRENRGGLRGEPEGQHPVPAGELRLPLSLQRLGYRTGCFGKWGLGPVGSSGDPLAQGFSRFYGYNCQAQAHNYYPDHLWSDRDKVLLSNPQFAAHQKLPQDADPHDPASYAAYSGTAFAPDLIHAAALEFLRAEPRQPFFLLYSTTIPHLALQVPADSLQAFAGKYPEEPYRGERGYLPQRLPRAAYAALVTRLDRYVGELLDQLRDLGLERNTIVIFTSDNGPLYDRLGGTDTEFFASAAGWRGRKGSFYEGGFRVPLLVRWPTRIAAGTVSDRVTGFEDWLPTLLDAAGEASAIPTECDGISFVPTLLGETQTERAFLYRESPGYGGQQALRVGDWKAIRTNLNPGPRAAQPPELRTQLYNLREDPGESHDLAAEQPQRVAELEAILAREHTPSPLWPIRGLDDPAPAPGSLSPATDR